MLTSFDCARAGPAASNASVAAPSTRTTMRWLRTMTTTPMTGQIRPATGVALALSTTTLGYRPGKNHLQRQYLGTILELPFWNASKLARDDLMHQWTIRRHSGLSSGAFDAAHRRGPPGSWLREATGAG